MTTRCPHCGGWVEMIAVVNPNAVAAVIDDRTIDDLADHKPRLISCRLYNAVKNAGLATVDDMAVMPDAYWLQIKNFGRVSLNELRRLAPFRPDPVRAAVVKAKLREAWENQAERLRRLKLGQEEARLREMVKRMYPESNQP